MTGRDTQSPPRRGLLGALAGAVLTSLLARGLGLIRGLGVARLLAPELYGVSATVAMILSYGQYLDLGSSNAAFRTAASAVGRDEQAEAARVAGHIGTLKAAAATTVGLLTVLISFAPGMRQEIRLALRLLPGIALATSLLAASILQMQAFSRAGDVNLTSAVSATSDLVLVLGLTWLAGLPGLLAGLVVAPTLALGFALRRIPGHLVAAVSRSAGLRYAKIGFPLVLLALVDHNLVYIDQVIVLAFFSVRELGIYNIALIAADVLRILSLAVGIVIGPRLIAAYARSRGDLEALRPYTVTPVHFCAAVAPFAIAALWATTGYGIARFYARYAAAVRPMQVLFLGYYFLVVLGGVTTFLFAIDKHRKNLWFLVPALGLNVAVDIILIKAGCGLMAVAIGSATTYVMYGVAGLCYVASHFQFRPREWGSFLAGALLPGLYLLCIVGLIEWRFSYRDSALTAATATVVGEVLLLPLGVRAWRLARALNGLQ